MARLLPRWKQPLIGPGKVPARIVESLSDFHLCGVTDHDSDMVLIESLAIRVADLELVSAGPKCELLGLGSCARIATVDVNGSVLLVRVEFDFAIIGSHVRVRIWVRVYEEGVEEWPALNDDDVPSLRRHGRRQDQESSRRCGQS